MKFFLQALSYTVWAAEMRLILFAVNQVIQNSVSVFCWYCSLFVLPHPHPPPIPPKAVFVNCVCREMMNKQICLLNLDVDIVMLFVRNTVSARSF